MIKDRACGILLHITSLPSKFGIGDLGPEAYKFANFLYNSKIKFWQILPLNPTNINTGNSPYSSDSAFAGNTLLISPEILAEEGLIEKLELKKLNVQEDLENIRNNKIMLLKKAFMSFKKNNKATYQLKKFENGHNYWLNDFALFRLLKSINKNKSWTQWPDEIKNRDSREINKFIKENQEQIEEQNFFQYLFFRQWLALKKYCNKKNISIIGDIPYYVSHDSADVWTFPKYFKLDKNKMPAFVGGVPPDYFSKTGQLWGNPAYNWNVLMKHDFDWWIKRIQHNLKWTNFLRVDHFRAFSAYWEVSGNEKTAENGKWVKVPGGDFFTKLKPTNKKLPIIAEDLGEIDQPVKDLIKKFKFPGMKVLQFVFDSKISDSQDAPHSHIQNCIVYTGTHDSPTTRSWFNMARAEDRQKVNKYLGRKVNEKSAAENFIRMALMSVANLCVIPMQDFLNLGDEATMNRPGTSEGNWKWRLKSNQLTSDLQLHIAELIKTYERD